MEFWGSWFFVPFCTMLVIWLFVFLREDHKARKAAERKYIFWAEISAEEKEYLEWEKQHCGGANYKETPR
jgi:hypothetical protein